MIGILQQGLFNSPVGKVWRHNLTQRQRVSWSNTTICRWKFYCELQQEHGASINHQSKTNNKMKQISTSQMWSEGNDVTGLTSKITWGSSGWFRRGRKKWKWHITFLSWSNSLKYKWHYYTVQHPLVQYKDVVNSDNKTHIWQYLLHV